VRPTARHRQPGGARVPGRRGRQPPASDSELSRWAAQRLEPHKVPSQYEWVPTLPRTASGKLIRAALRAPKAVKA
jgi:acyl-coenzyme A synthetase/AMP-(fatty) acid ligase